MNRFGKLCLLIALMVGGVQAQEDVILQSYALATEHLSRVLAALTADPVASRDALASAQQAVRPLSRDTVSVSLVPSIEAAFGRARTAIDNRSDTDLVVQVTVIRGGLQRMVYESALRAVNGGELSAARERLLRIAADIGVESALLAALAEAPAEALFATFEQGVAQVAAGHLALAQQSAEVPAAYRSLATSYSALIPVQDSPRLPPALLPTLTAAFDDLVAGEQAALAERLVAVAGLLENFAANAQRAASASAEAAPTAAAPEPVPAEAAPTEAVPAEVAAPVSVPEAPALGEAVAGVSEITSVPAAAARDETREALIERFGALGLNVALSASLADTYLDNGYRSLDEVLNALFAASSTMLTATATADTVQFATALSRYRSLYGTYLSPIITRQAPDLAQRTSRILLALEGSPDVRLQDASALLGQTQAMAEVIAGRTAAGLLGLFAETTLIWGGWLRSAVMLLLAILAFVPLWLLQLAFGGGNRNWRLIGLALLLLLLPVIYEGFSALGAVLAELTGVGALAMLAPFSIFQNNFSQALWSLLMVLAIALASAGLYGICVQFGLLGKQALPVEATVIHNPTMPEGADDVIEWDEEF